MLTGLAPEGKLSPLSPGRPYGHFIMVVISLSLLLKSPSGYLLACCAAGFICGSRPLNGTFISFVEKSDGATTFLKSDYRFSIGF